MDDRDIIALYWQRAERAIHETAAKYGGLCYTIAHNILSSREDSEECVNDTWLRAWNAMPPQKPERFSAFVARVTRNLALKRFDHVNAQKRNPVAVRSLEELGECVSGRESVETEVEARRLKELLDAFLWAQDEERRNIFLLRYWYFESIDGICRRTGYSRSKIKSMLFHTRKKLRAYLEKEGVAL